MNATTFDVRVWAIRRNQVANGVRYQVRWKVGRRVHYKTCATRKLADSFPIRAERCGPRRGAVRPRIRPPPAHAADPRRRLTHRCHLGRRRSYGCRADPARRSAEQPADLPDSGYDPAVMDALLGPALQPGRTPGPVDWAGLDAATAAEAWAALDAWVRWLARRYAIDHRELPACWYAHGDLVEELSALHTAHQAAYHPAGPGTGPADWHHQLAATRPRLHTSVARTGCKPGDHRPPTVPGWAADPAPPDYTAGLASHIATDLASRYRPGRCARAGSSLSMNTPLLDTPGRHP